MQAVILAAGRGSRMGKLTERQPKPMLKVAGKTLLEHKFDVLPDEVDEIILIVGYLKEKIIERFGDSYGDKRLLYIEQKDIVGGTMDALLQAKDVLTGKFIVMMGDDIYSQSDIEACSALEWAVLVKRASDTGTGAQVIVGADGRVTDIVEYGEHVGGGGMVNTNMFVLDRRVFDYKAVPKTVGSSELGLPQTVLAASQEGSIPLAVVEATFWVQITSPDDLDRAEALLSTT